VRPARLRCPLVAVLLLLLAAPALAAPLPGTETAKDRAAWRAILHWPAGCESDWQTGHPEIAGIDVWTAPASRKLVGVTCFTGAYQGTTMLYLVDGAGRRTGPLKLRIYQDPGSGKPTLTTTAKPLGVLGYTPKTRVLTIFDKARGPADCGIYSTFRLAGSRFVPVSARAKTACDGKPPYDPTRWPRLPVPKAAP
jgi:hypothetical protein